MKETYINGDLGQCANHGYMAFPIVISSLGNIDKISPVYKCREQIITNFTSRVMMTNSNTPMIKVLDKARIIVFALQKSDVTTKRLSNILKPIRMLEEEVGFPRTTVKHLVSKKYPARNILMFEGSNKWYRSSQTMSLWLLLIRTCLRSYKILNSSTYEEMVKRGKALPSGATSNGMEWAKEDQRSIAKSIHIWSPMLKNINKVFPFQRPWKERFDKRKVHKNANNTKTYLNSCSNEGIFYFGKGISQHVGYNILKEIMEKDK